MITQCKAYEVKLQLEAIINNNGLWIIHGRPDSDFAQARAQQMHNLLTSRLNVYNIQHTFCFLNPDDVAFLEKYRA